MNSEVIEQLGTQIDEAFFVIGGLILLIELAESLFKGSLKGKKILEMVASASTQIPYLLVETLILTGAYGLYYIIHYSLISWSIPVTWWTVVLVVLLADLTYYWEHRIAHEVRILWTQHAVHHSSRDYNIITGIRFGPFEGAWSLVAHAPLALIGFPPELVFFGIVTVLAYQTWLHTETIGKLGPLEMILNTPSHHRVHHGSDDKYLDRNYGGISIVWDRLFGTFQVEEETPIYGLKRDFNSQNPIHVWFSEIPDLAKDLKKSRNGSEIWNYLFSRPGWKPYRTSDTDSIGQQSKS